MSWDARYATKDYLFGTEPAPFIKHAASYLPPSNKVLAVADGEGRNSVWLATQGHDVTAFDISANALTKARALAERHNTTVNFYQAGMEGWDWTPEAYDAVAAVFIQFLDPEARGVAFQDFDRTLRPGGTLLLHGFAPRQIEYGTGGPPHRENMYTLEALHAAFPGYTVLHEKDYDAEIHSGSGHNGVAGLIDFVARKPLAS